jgi:hypothetical protein
MKDAWRKQITEDGNALEFPTQEGFWQPYYSDVKSVYVK